MKRVERRLSGIVSEEKAVVESDLDTVSCSGNIRRHPHRLTGTGKRELLCGLQRQGRRCTNRVGKAQRLAFERCQICRDGDRRGGKSFWCQTEGIGLRQSDLAAIGKGFQLGVKHLQCGHNRCRDVRVGTGSGEPNLIRTARRACGQRQVGRSSRAKNRDHLAVENRIACREIDRRPTHELVGRGELV